MEIREHFSEAGDIRGYEGKNLQEKPQREPANERANKGEGGEGGAETKESKQQRANKK